MTRYRMVLATGRVCVLFIAVLGLTTSAIPQNPRRQLDVPPVPSPPEVVAMIIQLAALNKKSVLVDLGCGDGRIVLAAAKARARAICVEIDGYMLEQSRRNAQ